MHLDPDDRDEPNDTDEPDDPEQQKLFQCVSGNMDSKRIRLYLGLDNLVCCSSSSHQTSGAPLCCLEQMLGPSIMMNHFRDSFRDPDKASFQI